MKRFLSVLLAFFLSAALFAQEDFSVLDSKLDEYICALEGESAEVKQQECDIIISSCRTEAVRDHVARKLYSHFISSRLMGDDAVAIYLTDNWFSPGKASLGSEVELMNARIFADFNRSSLIGRPAPELVLQDPSGQWRDALPKNGRQKVLLFHDTDCSTCKLQNALLKHFFSKNAFVLDFISVYAGSDAQAWEKYCKETESYKTDRIRVFNYWDPEVSSDYPLKYGVMSTPKMFLIDPEGEIAGRELDALSLETLLTARKEAFKQVTSEMLFTLWESPDEQSRLSAEYVADSLVLSRPDIWDTREDTLKVVGMASLVKDMMYRAAIGSRMPSLRVRGTLLRSCGSRTVRRRLDRLCGETRVIFFSPTCNTCKGLLESLSPAKGERYFLVDIDSQNPEMQESLLESFDLSVLPHIILVDRKGTVLRKYMAL